MGRPLKKKLYQDPAADGYQFDEVDAWIPGEGAAEKCYITRQAGTYKFVCVGKTSAAEGQCRLVDKNAGSLGEGEMSMTCTPFGGSPERVRSLTTNRVRTFAGNQYKWKAEEPADAVGKADLDQLVSDLVTVDFTMTAGSAVNGPAAWRGYTLGDAVIGFFAGTIGTLDPTTVDIGGNEGAILTDLTAFLFSPPSEIQPDTISIYVSHEGGVEIPEGFWIDLIVGGETYRLVANQSFFVDEDYRDFTLLGNGEAGASAQLTAYFESQGSNPFAVQIRYLG